MALAQPGCPPTASENPLPRLPHLLLFSAIWATALPAPAAESGRLRVMIETDAPGGDPDDLGSLVRFFCYANEWDIEGIFCTRRADQATNREGGKACLLRFIRAYEEAWLKLTTHDPRFPTPDALRAVTHASADVAARDAIVRAADRADPRPIWYVNWGTDDGNPTAMRRALDHVKATRPPADYRAFVDRFCFSRDARHVSEHIPHLRFWVDTRDPDRWYRRFAPLTATAGGFDVEKDVKTGHGKLGSYYSIQKEGDTPGFLVLVPTGLSDPTRPGWGSWAGRFAPRTDQYRRDGLFWSDAADAWRGTTSRDNTLLRWAEQLQNDFKARMDWFVRDFAGANHPPVPVLGGVAGLAHVEVTAKPGATVKLSAAGSRDPDGDPLHYEWFVYPEAGSYRGAAAVRGDTSAEAELALPADARGKSLHVILQVTDGGSPPLTRYRRLVIDCRE